MNHVSPTYYREEAITSAKRYVAFKNTKRIQREKAKACVLIPLAIGALIYALSVLFS